MLRIAVVCVAFAIVHLLAQPALAIVTVDNFTTAPNTLTVNFAGSDFANDASPSVLGGSRASYIDIGDGDATVEIANMNSQLDLEVFAGAFPPTIYLFELGYGYTADGSGINTLSPFSQDLGMLDTLAVDVDAPGDASIFVTIVSDGGSVTSSFPGAFLNAGVNEIPLSAFSPAVVTSDINALRITLDGDADFTPVRLNSIQFIPEPATLSLLAVGSLLAMRRRR